MNTPPDLVLTIARGANEGVLLPLVRAYHEFEHVALSDDERRAAIAPLLADDPRSDASGSSAQPHGRSDTS